MKETNKMRKYRPVSILNRMSKIYGRWIRNSPPSYAETILIIDIIIIIIIIIII